MTYDLTLVQGGLSSAVDGVGAGGFSPDQPLFGLLDEARMLEAKDRLFNKKLEWAIENSDAWFNGDRKTALNVNAARALREDHQPVLDRLSEIPDLIVSTPAFSKRGIVEKLQYLASHLDGVEAEIVASVIEDIEYQR